MSRRMVSKFALRGITSLQTTLRASSIQTAAAVPETAAKNSNDKEGKVLHPELINENIKKAQYAVRGELYLRGEELRREGKEIIFTNVGNPHALNAQPLTFPRQVLALATAPFLMDHPKVTEMFPMDAINRAKHVIKNLKSVGAYTDSKGALFIREEVAKFIEERDGHPSSPENIFLTDGASVGVRLALSAILRDSDDCILVPIPQYPLYSASITLYGGSLVGYYLNEKEAWGMNLKTLKETIAQMKEKGKNCRGLVFINPGNPTGQCLSKSNLSELIKLAHEEKLVLMADEVYQENVYQDERPFVSAKKLLREAGEPYASSVELVSFHTISKGTAGECGLRGGYFEITNIHPETSSEFYKCVSINLCPNVIGQIGMSLMVNPPKPGDQSYELFKKEKKAELESLRRRAHMVTDAFNSMEGITCNFVEGAMYAFPKLTLPPKAIAAAKAAGKAPDAFYCLKLLEETGISTVPGSGFGQEEGTFHLRTTILPREEKMEEFCTKFENFNKEFRKQYS